MIVIRIELWPGGDAAKARVIGFGEITNVGGNAELGDYSVRLLKSSEYASKRNVGTTWRSGTVIDFPRLKLGPWDLLYRALKSAVGKRNKKV